MKPSIKRALKNLKQIGIYHELLWKTFNRETIGNVEIINVTPLCFGFVGHIQYEAVYRLSLCDETVHEITVCL